jgi:quercetin dioxygenase-like cupin family protein
LFINKGELQQKELASGVTTSLAWGEKIMLSLVKLNPNAIVPSHSHPHEQMALVLSGKLEVTIGNERRLLNEGDVFLVPSGAEHSVKNLNSETQVLDIFSPPREDFK